MQKKNMDQLFIAAKELTKETENYDNNFNTNRHFYITSRKKFVLKNEKQPFAV